jgi:hypothetical protein
VQACLADASTAFVAVEWWRLVSLLYLSLPTFPSFTLIPMAPVFPLCKVEGKHSYEPKQRRKRRN